MTNITFLNPVVFAPSMKGTCTANLTHVSTNPVGAAIYPVEIERVAMLESLDTLLRSFAPQARQTGAIGRVMGLIGCRKEVFLRSACSYNWSPYSGLISDEKRAPKAHSRALGALQSSKFESVRTQNLSKLLRNCRGSLSHKCAAGSQSLCCC